MTAVADLGRRALAGDRAAWNQLIADHNQRVVVSLLARGVPMERAKELAQETWMRLLAQQRQGRLSALSLPGLAIAQAAFLARDDARAPRATATDLDDAGVVDIRDRAAGAEERLVGHEQLVRLREAVADLSPSARRVFTLVYDDPEIDHAEAARRTGLSLQRVRQIICEVRRQLRPLFEEVNRE